MLGVLLAFVQKRADVDIGQLTAGWEIGLVPDEHAANGITTKESPISVGTAVKLPFLGGHLSVFAALDARQSCCAPFHVGFLCQFNYPYPELLDYFWLRCGSYQSTALACLFS